MATKRVPKTRQIRVYIVVMILRDMPAGFVCSDIVDEQDGFLRCGTCPGLTREKLREWGMRKDVDKLRRNTWINKQHVHLVEELGEYNE
jgi:hypothetical protein